MPHNCWVTPLQRFEETGGPTERFWNRKATSQLKFDWLCKLKVRKNQTFEHGDNVKYFTLMSRHERNDFETEIWSEKTQFWNLSTLEVAQKFKTTFQITIEMKHELLIALMTRQREQKFWMLKRLSALANRALKSNKGHQRFFRTVVYLISGVKMKYSVNWLACILSIKPTKFLKHVKN